VSVDVVVKSFGGRTCESAASVLEDLFGYEPAQALRLASRLPTTVVARTSFTHGEIAAGQLRDEGFEVEVVECDAPQAAKAPAPADSPAAKAAAMAASAAAALSGGRVQAQTASAQEKPGQALGGAAPTPVQHQSALDKVKNFNELVEKVQDAAELFDFGDAPSVSRTADKLGGQALKSAGNAAQAATHDPFADIDEASFGATPRSTAAGATSTPAGDYSLSSKYAGFADSAPVVKNGVSDDDILGAFQAPVDIDKAFSSSGNGPGSGKSQPAQSRGHESRDGGYRPQQPARAPSVSTEDVLGDPPAPISKAAMLKAMAVKAVAAAAVVGSVAAGGVALMGTSAAKGASAHAAKAQASATAKSYMAARAAGVKSAMPPPLHPVLQIAPKSLHGAFTRILRQRVAGTYKVQVEFDDGSMPADVECMLMRRDSKYDEKRMDMMLKTGVPVEVPDEVKTQFAEHVEAIRAAENDPKLALDPLCMSVSEHEKQTLAALEKGDGALATGNESEARTDGDKGAASKDEVSVGSGDKGESSVAGSPGAAKKGDGSQTGVALEVPSELEKEF
jgi:hypothetical protein